MLLHGPDIRDAAYMDRRFDYGNNYDEGLTNCILVKLYSYKPYINSYRAAKEGSCSRTQHMVSPPKPGGIPHYYTLYHPTPCHSAQTYKVVDGSVKRAGV